VSELFEASNAAFTNRQEKIQMSSDTDPLAEIVKRHEARARYLRRLQDRCGVRVGGRLADMAALIEMVRERGEEIAEKRRLLQAARDQLRALRRDLRRRGRIYTTEIKRLRGLVEQAHNCLDEQRRRMMRWGKSHEEIDGVLAAARGEGEGSDGE
jgi:hypothetical protein